MLVIKSEKPERKGALHKILWQWSWKFSQSNYGRLEKDDNRLTVPKLLKIAEVLGVNVSYLFGEKATNIIHHNNGDNTQAFVGTIYSDKDHIQSLKEEILFKKA